MAPIFKFLRHRILPRDPSGTLFSAGAKASTQYALTRRPLYLEVAVQDHQAALNIRVSGHPHRLESLFYTAMSLWAHCQGAVTKENSSTVIAYYDEALLLLPDKPSKRERRATIYTNLGMVYLTLFRLGKEDPEAFPATGSNIDKAIENYRSALQLRPAKNDPDRPSSLINLSIALVQKDSKDGLMSAIINLREAEELCTTKPTSRPLLLLSLNNLVQAYDSHYRYSKDISDVIGKVDVLQRILDLTDEGKGRLVPLVNLMNARWRLYETEHNRSNDLDQTVFRRREILKLSVGRHNIIHIKALIILADALFAGHLQTSPKNVTDLDEAIQCYRKAIDPGPEDAIGPGPEGGPDLDTDNGPNPVLFSSLASAIYIRCQDLEEVEGATLEDAIHYNQKALHTCPKDGPLYLKIQNNLGSIYLTQFNKLGEEGDLVKGIQAYEDVVSHCPDVRDDDFTFYQATLENLKRALQDKREGRTDVLTRHQERSEPETGKVSISTKFKLRRRQSLAGSWRSIPQSVVDGWRSRQSVADSWRSRQSSDESCPSSSSASTISTLGD